MTTDERPEGAVAAPAMPTRVALIDDHPAVREGLRGMLRLGGEHMLVVAEFASFSEALVRIPVVKPDLLLADFRVPDMTFAEFINDLKEAMPDLPVLVVSASTSRSDVIYALRAGAAGFVSKSVGVTELRDAVNAVRRNEIWATPDVIESLFHG